MVKRLRDIIVALATGVLLMPAGVSANLLQSSHFRLDPNVAASFGGGSGSVSYKLTDTGGEAVVGAGASQSFKLGQGYVRQLVHSIQLSVLPSGTYAYWPFDTGTGSVAYDVGSGSDDATLIGSPGWGSGMVGQAVTLNGSSQYVTTAKQISGPTAFTMEFWFKSTSVSGGELMGFGDAATGASTNLDRLVYLRSDGKLTFGTKPSGYKTVTTASSYNDGSWHYVVASLGTAGLELYIDGVKRGADPTTTTAASYSGYWRFGYDNLAGWPTAPGSNYAAATIDEGRVYSRQIRDDEVTNDYTAGANALQSAFTLPDVTPGQSQTYSVDAVVKTDAGGYDLLMQEPKPLTHTDTTTTIPAISGSIASPMSWVEGTTKGFGFTLSAFPGTDLNFGTSPTYTAPNGLYAALPSASTVYHSRTGLSGGSFETTTIQYRADTTQSQKQGTYSTTVVYTATAKP